MFNYHIYFITLPGSALNVYQTKFNHHTLFPPAPLHSHLLTQVRIRVASPTQNRIPVLNIQDESKGLPKYLWTHIMNMTIACIIFITNKNKVRYPITNVRRADGRRSLLSTFRACYARTRAHEDLASAQDVLSTN